MSWPWVFFLHQFICNPFQSNLCNESVTAETETDWAEVQVILNIIMIFYRNYSNRNTIRSLGRNRKGIYILSHSRATPPPLVSTAASVVSAAGWLRDPPWHQLPAEETPRDEARKLNYFLSFGFLTHYVLLSTAATSQAAHFDFSKKFPPTNKPLTISWPRQ